MSDARSIDEIAKEVRAGVETLMAVESRSVETKCADLLAILADRDALKARVAALEATLAETLAVATRNEDGEFANRARAILNEAPETQKPPPAIGQRQA